MNSRVWTYTPTEKSLAKQFREIFNNLEEELDKIHNDMIMKIECIIKRSKENPIIKPLDNNLCIISDVKKLENDNYDLSISTINNVSTSSVEINNDIDNISLSEIGNIDEDSMDLEFSEEVTMKFSSSNDDNNNYDDNYDSCESECDYSEVYDDDITDLDDFESFDIINESEDSFSFDSKFSEYDCFFDDHVTTIGDHTVKQINTSEYITPFKGDSRGAQSIKERIRAIFQEEEGSSRMLWDPGKVSKDVDIPLL